MNRLKPSSSTTASPLLLKLDFDTPADGFGKQGASDRGVNLYDPDEPLAPISSFVPLHYENKYKYPLIVWLHGEGQSERDLPHVMRHVSLRNYVAVAPRGTVDLDDGFAWDDDSAATEEAMGRVSDAIAHARGKLNIHTGRVFLAGVGCGGAMAMRVAMSHPHDFAGVATFDGALPHGRRLLSRVNELRDLPMLLSGSRDSAAYPEAKLCENLRLLHSAGATVSVRQYPGSDDLTTAMLEDFDRWLMEIVCGATANV